MKTAKALAYMGEMGHNGLIEIAEGGDLVGFFDKLFGNDASFLGFMDLTGELEDETTPDEVEITFTIEVEDSRKEKGGDKL